MRMQDVFTQLGLSEPETKAYLYVLDQGSVAAREVAAHIKQTRTNTYAILNRLVERSLLQADDATKVRRFIAVDPIALKQQVTSRQRELHMLSKSVEAITPELSSRYALGLQKPGVLYLEGMEGLKTSLEDMARSKTDILLWGSSTVNQHKEAYETLYKAAYKRKARGIATRVLFEAGARQWSHIHTFADRNFTVRLSMNDPIESEITIYDDKVCMTTYLPNIIVTVLTNKNIADMYRVIFEEAWRHSQPIV